MSRQSVAPLAVVESAEKDEEAERRKRHKAQNDAAGRMDMDPARLGSELSAEDRPSVESETAENLKRGD